VSGYAWATGCGVNIAWAFRSGRSSILSRPGLFGYHQHSFGQCERKCENYQKTDSRFHVYSPAFYSLFIHKKSPFKKMLQAAWIWSVAFNTRQ
jgi:hypothetical protein